MNTIEMFHSEKQCVKNALVTITGQAAITLTTIIFTSIARIKFIVLVLVVLAKLVIRVSADTRLVIILVAYVTKRQI